MILSSLMLTCCLAGYNDAKSAPDHGQSRSLAPTNTIQAARAEFAKGQWDTAITLYRRHLRAVPNDYQAWNQLAAAYYHSGQVRSALNTLQRIQRNSPDRSFNYFYQGMCLAVLNGDKSALKHWEFAAYWQDEFGARATYELGAAHYRAGDDGKAKQWLTTYIQKYPRGPDVASAKELLKSINEGGSRIDPVKAFERPDPELTVFKYHPWSLFNSPHFWQVQVQSRGFEQQIYEPTTSEGLKENTITDYSLGVKASIGVGPIRQKGATSFAGYTYIQDWIIQMEALEGFFSSLNLEFLPIRGDMMERTHRFFGDVRKQFSPNLFAGAYARIEFSRVGSSFFPSPDDSSLKVVTPTTDSQLLIPWVGWTWSETSRSQFSLYLRKDIHLQSSEHSNKTFEINFNSEQPAISLSLSHALDFPSRDLQLNFDIFQYEFIFNDYFLDYSRLGGIAEAQYEVFKDFGAKLLVGLYQDSYKLPHIRTGKCGAPAAATNGEQQGDATRSSCRRSDSGQMLQVALYWDKSPNLRFSFNGLMVENKSNQKVFSKSKLVYVGGVSWAFPGTVRVSKMTERFADAAFTKDTFE